VFSTQSRTSRSWSFKPNVDVPLTRVSLEQVEHEQAWPFGHRPLLCRSCVSTQGMAHRAKRLVVSADGRWPIPADPAGMAASQANGASGGPDTCGLLTSPTAGGVCGPPCPQLSRSGRGSSPARPRSTLSDSSRCRCIPSASFSRPPPTRVLEVGLEAGQECGRRHDHGVPGA
jgi:hypothetical protein